METEERCDMSDLFPSQCAHCRKLPDVLPTDGLLFENETTATYDGKCALDDSHPIEVGDVIAMAIDDKGADQLDVGWVCPRCIVAAGKYWERQLREAYRA